MSQIREQFLQNAKSYLGCRESDGSHRKIIDAYNGISPLPRGYRLSYREPWCAAFVSTAGRGMEGIIPECSCDVMIEGYKRQGKWRSREHKPQPGDLVFYDWDKSGTADHVGIVCESSESLRIIEGNISDSVAYRSIAPDYPYIVGYACPFDEAEMGAALSTVELELPLISCGSRGNSVKALQHLLIGNGCSCGVCGADGDFGIRTEEALLSYQRSRSLTADAIAGKQTWSSLLL